MRIAVIADTHGSLPGSVLPDLKKADEIWHLGDFCDVTTLEAVHRIGPPVEAVFGNNDYGLELRLTRSLERGGRTFFLIHIPPRQPPETEFLLHGHTHIPRDEILGGVRFLNPGTIGKPNKGAPSGYAWLTIAADGMVTWERVQI